MCAHQDGPWLPHRLSGESHCPLKGQSRPSCNPALLFIISPHLPAVSVQRRRARGGGGISDNAQHRRNTKVSGGCQLLGPSLSLVRLSVTLNVNPASRSPTGGSATGAEVSLRCGGGWGAGGALIACEMIMYALYQKKENRAVLLFLTN